MITISHIKSTLGGKHQDSGGTNETKHRSIRCSRRRYLKISFERTSKILDASYLGVDHAVKFSYRATLLACLIYYGVGAVRANYC
jgi:hypothetical protein